MMAGTFKFKAVGCFYYLFFNCIMPSLAWFSDIGKILKDLQFHCSQIVPNFGDIMGNRQVSLPNSSACHFLFVTQWYCS